MARERTPHDPSVLVDNYGQRAWFMLKESFTRNEARALVSKEADFPYMYLKTRVVWMRRRFGWWELCYNGESGAHAYWQVDGGGYGLNKYALL